MRCTLSAPLWSLLVLACPAVADGPTVEPLAPLTGEVKAELKAVLKGTTDAPPLRFALGKATQDGKPAPTVGLAIDAGTGAIGWKPTPSQAGSWEIAVSVKDAKDREATATIKAVVKPGVITSTRSPVGDLLRKWYAEGTAAGNTGDWYDNRDRTHSMLGMGAYPQLDIVLYTEEQLRVRFDWAAQRVILNHPTFGNSSTSAPPTAGGSNIRSYYTNPRGLAFLYEQYRRNNIYMYPEHRDHDPGHNGPDGYGDLYPTNTPFLIASQGSSGSDQPFMRVVPYTMAALRPEVKRKLIEAGLLMPTIQMLLRSTNKHLKSPDEYLTGKAHPTVFEGSWVNDLAMVTAAHDILPDNIPPLVGLKVIEEDKPVAGRDWFDPARNEVLADTPSVIARIVRSTQAARRMVVSAKDSADVNKRPLTYKWVVLRGDAARITIKPLDAAGSTVELVVPHHDRFLNASPTPIETDRVDIGVFVHNGVYWSAPGFITFHHLDDEARTYGPDGKLIEVAYGAGAATTSVSDWGSLLEQASADTPAAKLLRGSTAPEAFAKAAADYKAAMASQTVAKDAHKKAVDARTKADAALKAAAEQDRPALTEARKKAEAEVSAAQKTVDAAGRTVTDVLAVKREGLATPIKPMVEQALDGLRRDVNFARNPAVAAAFGSADAARKARFEALRKRLIDSGVAIASPDGSLTVLSVRGGSEPVDQRLTKWERTQVERFNADTLAWLYGGAVTSAFRANFVDQRLSSPKHWRDVYRHDAAGKVIGWTRIADGSAPVDYTADGMQIVARDAKGRVSKARPVRYDYKAGAGNVMSIVPTPGMPEVEYEYDGDGDTKGRVRK